MTEQTTFFAQWEDTPEAEPLGGDNLEAAARISRVQELREQREAEERQAELEDRAEQLLRNALTLSEVLERAERQSRAQDYSTDRRDAAERQELLAGGGIAYDAGNLTDLKIKARAEGARREREDAQAREERRVPRWAASGRPKPEQPAQAAAAAPQKLRWRP